MKKKFSTLSKLEIVMKVPKAERIETKKLQATINKQCEGEARTDLKQLFVPDHYLCLISGEVMKDPVILESGRTFERANIIEYFRVQREKAARAIAEADGDIDE